ncbi:MAG: hypothetical protein DRQ62_08680, partial [Gammaproteobacteria bacterium]
SYVAKNPSDPKAHLLLVLGYVGTQDFTALDIHLDELTQQIPVLADAVKFQVATYFAKQHRFYLALKYLDTISAKYSQHELLSLRGEIYLNQNLISEAITTYEQLYNLDNQATDTLFTLARLHILKGNYNKASEYAKKLLTQEPAFTPGMVLLTTSYLMAGDVKLAKKTSEDILKLDPANTFAAFYLGLTNLLSGQQTAAISAFKTAIAVTDFRDAQYGMSLAYLKSQDIGNAQKHLNQYISITPNDSLSALLSAAIALQQGNKTQAITAYKKAGKLFIDLESGAFNFDSFVNSSDADSATQLALANFLYRQGFYNLTNDAIKNDAPSAILLYLTKTRALRELGKEKQAISRYSKLADKYPELMMPVIEIADIEYAQGNKEKTLAGYLQVTKKHPKIIALRFKLATLYNELNQPEKAIQEFQAILQQQKSDVVLNELASTYLEKLNAPKEALKFAVQASKINAANDNVKYTLADIYYQLGDYRKSNSLYQEVAKKVTGNSSFYCKVAEAALKTGNKDRAAIYFEKALSTGQDFPEHANAEKQLHALQYK